MPSTICDACRLVMDYCYRFKQMCKKADTALKQYTLTGVWPSSYESPKYPEELSAKVCLIHNNLVLANAHTSLSLSLLGEQTQPLSAKKSPQTINLLNKRKQVNASATPSPPKKVIKLLKVERLSPDKMMLDMEAHEPPLSPTMPPSPPMQMISQPTPKILNKSTVKILNKQAPGSEIEPILKKPVIKTNKSGNVEIVSEILQNSETDPLKNAHPVETNVFPCPCCERSFPLKQLLDIHQLNHDRDRKFLCEVCNKGFFSKYDLGKHMLIHTGEKPFVCVVCQKAFSRSTLLRRHEKIHIDQPKFLCVYCERPFLSKEELDKHTANHLKNRPFVCKVCGKGFAFKQGLERHEAVHSNDKQHKCEYCDQSFSTQSKLARHLTAHAGSRPYPCRLCPKSYLLSHHLTRHMRSHKEADSGSYKCLECEEVFQNRDELIYHSAVHATESLTCPLCKEHFEDIEKVTEHIKSHTEGDQFACEFCDSIFVTEDKLQAHSDTEHAVEIAKYYDNNDTNVIRLASAPTSRREKTHEIEILEEYIIDDNMMIQSKMEDINDDSGDIETHDTHEAYEDSIHFEITEFSATDEISAPSPSPPPSSPAPKVQASIKSYLQSRSPGAARKPPNVAPLTRNVVVKRASGASEEVSSTSTTKSPKTRASAAAAAAAVQKETKLVRRPPPPKAPPTVATRTQKNVTTSPAVASPAIVKGKTGEMINMKIGDKVVKVQQIRMTKAQVAAMTKEGKIEFKDGQMMLKHSPTKK